MKIKCVFCQGWINNPKMGQMMCGKKECGKEYRKQYMRIYRRDPKNKKKLREHLNKYLQQSEVKKIIKIRKRIYNQALCKLRDNHREEFEEIHKKLKRKEK